MCIKLLIFMCEFVMLLQLKNFPFQHNSLFLVCQGSSASDDCFFITFMHDIKSFPLFSCDGISSSLLANE